MLYLWSLVAQKDILNNKNPGQDWHNVKAFKDGKIFSTPVGLHNWGGLSAETSLLPLFMINKFNPDYITDAELKVATRLHYKKCLIMKFRTRY